MLLACTRYCDARVPLRYLYLSDFVIARKTRSSMATDRVNSVAACPASATLLPFAPIAGPARFAAPFAGVDVPSPGCSEMREVLGVQLDTPRHVSRTKTWRYPLLLAPGLTLGCCGAWLWVTARNATNLPEALIDGRKPSVPVSAPFESTETTCVDGEQLPSAPEHVSRK